MQNTGQASGKKSYRVVLLLVVGLASLANTYKEVNQLRDMTLQTTSFVAQLQDVFAPANEPTIVSVETCQNRRMTPPAPPVPELAPVPPVPAVESDAIEVEVPAVAPVAPVAPAAARPVAPPAKLKAPEVPQPRRMRSVHGPAEVKVFVSTDDFEKNLKDAFESDQSFKALKAKNRRYIYVTPDGRDMLLKTINRSINLRSAS